MRYLFGDSKPFPLTFNFLATLEAFMSAATRVVQLETEGAKQKAQLAKTNQERVATVDTFDALHQSITVTVNQVITGGYGPRGTVSDSEPPPEIQEYAQKLNDYSAKLIQEKRMLAKAATDRETAELAVASDERDAEMKLHLEHFFRTVDVPVLSSRVSLKLVGRDAKSELGVVFRNQGDIVTGFTLSPAKHPVWTAPRKVSDFVPAFDLTVGTKKSFFKGVVTAEVVSLHDWVVGRADVHDRGAEIALRKKGELRDAYVFKLQKSSKGMTGEVDRPDDPNAKSLSPTLELDDVLKVDMLAQRIRESFEPLFAERETVVCVDLDSKDVFKHQLGLAVVSRLVKTFAPLVEEITSRSPSDQELSLKLEDDNGKREELYLRRDDLLKKLQPLNAEGRGVFAPLGLDDWVPTLTVRPPAAR